LTKEINSSRRSWWVDF